LNASSPTSHLFNEEFCTECRIDRASGLTGILYQAL
jgi:hypothetical protein